MTNNGWCLSALSHAQWISWSCLLRMRSRNWCLRVENITHFLKWMVNIIFTLCNYLPNIRSKFFIRWQKNGTYESMVKVYVKLHLKIYICWLLWMFCLLIAVSEDQNVEKNWCNKLFICLQISCISTENWKILREIKFIQCQYNVVISLQDIQWSLSCCVYGECEWCGHAWYTHENT